MSTRNLSEIIRSAHKHVHTAHCELYPNSCPEDRSYLGHPSRKSQKEKEEKSKSPPKDSTTQSTRRDA